MSLKKSKLFFSLLLIFEISTTLFAKATENPLSSTEWYESEALFTAIRRDLYDFCLEPFVKEGEQAEIRLLGRETSLDHLLIKGVTFIAATLTQGDTVFNIMLSAQRDPISKDIQVCVLYLSTESLPSARLVMDVYHLFNRLLNFRE